MTLPLSILITDDIPQNRIYILQIINYISINAQVDEAEDGDAATKQVTDHIANTGKSFDLIIMDFKMPVLNGQQATSRIRQIEREAKVEKQSIIITWSSAMSVPYEGADDFLPKIFTKFEFEQLLKSHHLV
jgi:CheY-like chemotaxis protein